MFWKDRRKHLPKFLVMLPGLAHSHSAGEGRLRKLIVRFLSAYAEGETERPPPNHPYLNDWRGTERERNHRPTSLTLTIEEERGLTLTIEGDRERETTTQPPSHLHLNDTRREGERPPPATFTLTIEGDKESKGGWVVVSLCLLLSLR